LLDSYEIERKPVHRMFVAEATENYAYVTHHMVNPTLERDDEEGAMARKQLGERIMMSKQREFKAIGAVLGYAYSPSPLVVADGTPETAHDPLVYTPTARPGSLAPHLWMDDGSSLYDQFGQGFTLLVIGKNHEQDAEALVQAARAQGVPLTLLRLQSEDAIALYDAPLVLVRPDQHVAWRAAHAPADPQALMRTITGRPPAPPTDTRQAPHA